MADNEPSSISYEWMDVLKQDVKQLHDIYNSLSTKIDEKTQQYKKISRKYDSLRKETENLQNVTEAQKQANQLRDAKARNLQARCNQLKEQIEVQEQQRMQKLAEIKRMNDALAQKKQEHDTLQVDLHDAKEKSDEAVARYTDLKEQWKNTEAEYEGLKKKATKLRDENARLEERNAALIRQTAQLETDVENYDSKQKQSVQSAAEIRAQIIHLHEQYKKIKSAHETMSRSSTDTNDDE